MTRINIRYSVLTPAQLAITAVIKRCIHTVLSAEKVNVPCEINVLVADDAQIRSINKETRNLDKATDVLSFPMFTLQAGETPENWDGYVDPETGRCPLGDMVISLERAVAQAKEFGHSTRREVGYLTIHSMLHLLGYDHLDEGPQKAQMRAREEQIAAMIPRMQR